jgi:ABC-type Fe3+ transport system permease subunit
VLIVMILTLLGVAAMIGGAALMIRATAHRRRPWSDRTTRRLAWAAFTWTVLAGVVLLLVPTVSVSSSGSMSSTGSPAEVVTTTSRETLLEHEGASVVAVLLVPVAVALVGALGDGPVTRRRRIAAGWVLGGACVLGAASLGIFFLPATGALLSAGLKTRHRTIGPEERGHADSSLNLPGQNLPGGVTAFRTYELSNAPAVTPRWRRATPSRVRLPSG